MKAKEKGFQDAMSGKPHPQGRAYETDKANKDYFDGYAEGLRKAHPTRMIVRCTRHLLIFAAIVQDYPKDQKFIECPGCARRYFKEDDKWVSDRDLKVIFEPLGVT